MVAPRLGRCSPGAGSRRLHVAARRSTWRRARRPHGQRGIVGGRRPANLAPAVRPGQRRLRGPAAAARGCMRPMGLRVKQKYFLCLGRSGSGAGGAAWAHAG